MIDLTEIPDFLRRRPKEQESPPRRYLNDHEGSVREDLNGSSGSRRSHEDEAPENRGGSDAQEASGG